MALLFRLSLSISLVLVGGIFGFFYAYVASGINGLNTMAGIDAINAMNAINGAIRNPIFFPFFFLPPVACFIACALARANMRPTSAIWLAIAGMVYLGGGILITMLVNVPMNETLMLVDTTTINVQQGDEIWDAYARDWYFWNALRTIFSGVALICVGSAIFRA